MEITIRPKNFKLHDDTQSQIRKRLERIPHHLDTLQTADVIITQQPTHLNPQRHEYRAQVTLHTRNNNPIRSEVTHDEVLTAIDQAMDHLSKRIERYRSRYDRKRKSTGVGRSSADMQLNLLGEEPSVAEMAGPAVPNMPSSASELLEGLPPSTVIGESDAEGNVVRTKRFTVKPLFPEDAIEQMELLGHTFFVFWNAAEEKVNVLYRRNDGNYGLIQPEFG